jgi:ABC-2 type transport system ATP-binding protein
MRLLEEDKTSNMRGASLLRNELQLQFGKPCREPFPYAWRPSYGVVDASAGFPNNALPFRWPTRMIEVRELLKYYGEHRATGPLSFTIEKGEIVGLLGLNGAGKTTALRVLACDLLPSSGTVLVDGIDVVDKPHEVRRRIGYLPDTPPLYSEMTVAEYLVFAARIRGLSAKDARRSAAAASEAAQLDDVSDTFISALSHGFRQRVGIAQAIVHRPQLLILDEPISGLDPVQIIEMRELLRDLRGEHTIVLSSHILTEISETCDRLLVLGEGRIVASGTEAELSKSLLDTAQIELTIRTSDSSRALALLGALEGVRDVVKIAPREPGDDVATFRLDAERDVREAVCRALVGEGMGLLEMVRSKHELESIFLKLTSVDDDVGTTRDSQWTAWESPS